MLTLLGVVDVPDPAEKGRGRKGEKKGERKKKGKEEDSDGQGPSFAKFEHFSSQFRGGRRCRDLKCTFNAQKFRRELRPRTPARLGLRHAGIPGRSPLLAAKSPGERKP